MTRQVIFLNGPSSAGKSTLAHALQAKLQRPYLHLGIDNLIAMMPAHLNNWEGGQATEGFWWKSAYDSQGHLLQHIQLGPYAKKISQLLKQLAVTMLDAGMNLIIDEICVGEESTMTEWKKVLAPYSVLYVGVTASIEQLERRESARGDRMSGSARAQAQTVHENVTYDLEINTDKFSLNDCVAEIQKMIE
jgi:chloramphenicol 3-O phosphotransferase